MVSWKGASASIFEQIAEIDLLHLRIDFMLDRIFILSPLSLDEFKCWKQNDRRVSRKIVKATAQIRIFSFHAMIYRVSQKHGLVFLGENGRLAP